MGDISRSYSEESMERWRVVGGSMVPRLISGASGGSQGDQERHEEGKGSKRGSHGASVAAGKSQHEYEETDYDSWSRENTRGGGREVGRGDMGSAGRSWGPMANRRPWRD